MVRSGRAALKSALQHLALAIVPLTLVLLLAEAVVRWTGIAETCPNRFSNSELWTCDPILHFKVNPELRPNDEALNSDGFRSAEFTPKPPGVYRILSLGDSCTFGYIAREEMIGYVLQPYPLKLQRFIERRVGEGKVEVLNAAVPGYNSYQGVMLLRTKLRGLDPDLITVRFGWNDHFLSARGERGGLYREPETRLGLLLEDLLLRTRLYAFVRRLGLELQALRQPVKDQARKAFQREKEWVPTIPLEDYEHNLRRIVEIGRSRGAEVWLLTSPRNPAPSDEAKDRLSKHNRIDFDRLMQIHDQYNDAVRRVGAEVGALVVDLDRIYRPYEGEPAFLPTDVPHPAQGGHVLEAEILYSALVRRGILRPAPEAGNPIRD
jgi:lysophospholipase L1-like esterase